MAGSSSGALNDNDVRVALYRAFVTSGAPPLPVELAAELEASAADVEAAYRRLADAHVLVLAPGTPYVWLANPLSALPSPFRVHTAGRDWYGVCIWDALGIVAMLGDYGSENGTVDTWCPDCDEPLRLDIVGGVITVADGGSALLHFAVPARHWWDDIGFT